MTKSSGVLLVVFGGLVALSALQVVLPRPDPASLAASVWHGARAAIFLLGILAVTALYARHAPDTGALAAVGYVATTVGLAFLVAGEVAFAVFVPFFARQAPEVMAQLEAGSLAPSVGMVALGVLVSVALVVGFACLFLAILKRTSLPKIAVVWTLVAGLMLAVADAVDVTAAFVATVLLGLGLLWMGVATIRGLHRRPVPVVGHPSATVRGGAATP